MKNNKVYLTLQNGKQFTGYSFGAEKEVVGELVFTTGMTGYIETLTDPSYYGQIVTQTFPLIGNYGMIEADTESKKPWVTAYIVREKCDKPSNFRCEGTIEEYLKRKGIPAIYGIDTREQTLRGESPEVQIRPGYRDNGIVPRDSASLAGRVHAKHDLLPLRLQYPPDRIQIPAIAQNQQRAGLFPRYRPPRTSCGTPRQRLYFPPDKKTRDHTIYSNIRKNSSSCIIRTPSFAAFSSFAGPIFSPARI